MFKKLFFIFSLSYFYTTAQVGEHVYSFLNIPTSAKQVALGGKTLTLLTNVNQAIYNPSTINNTMNNKLAVNYVNYLADIHIGAVTFAHKFAKTNTFHTGITYVNYGTLQGADVIGNLENSFHANELAMSIGYAYPISNSHFYVGNSIKLINSSIQRFSSWGIATNLGIIYYNTAKPFVITLVIRNAGFQLSSYNGTYEKLPLDIAIGGSYQLENVPLRFYGTIDNLQKWRIGIANPSNTTTNLEGNTQKETVSFINNAFRHVILGAELFPDKLVNIRIGYNFKRGEELKLKNKRTFSGLSVGFGVKMKRFTLHYAYAKYHAAANSSTFSLHINLNHKKNNSLTKYK